MTEKKLAFTIQRKISWQLQVIKHRSSHYSRRRNSPSSTSTVWYLEAIFSKWQRNVSTKSQRKFIIWFLKRWGSIIHFGCTKKPLAGFRGNSISAKKGRRVDIRRLFFWFIVCHSQNCYQLKCMLLFYLLSIAIQGILETFFSHSYLPQPLSANCLL